MQAVKVCLGDDYVNVDRSPGDLTSVSRPINIASVRAASLRTCGLRAAARAASSRGTSFSPQTGFSPTVSMASSANLSYTNSLEPGEDSQLNAFAMVDKLVDLNAGAMWQTPQSNTAAEQSSVKGSGLQCLAQSADMKNRQGKLGIFDWIDSQSDDTEKVSSTISTQSKQCQRITEQKEEYQATMSDMAMVKDLSSTVFKARVACSKREDSLKCQPVLAGSAKGICAKEGSTDFERFLSNSIQNNVVENIVNSELHDLDAHHERDETEVMDIGTNTQVALEAMNIMRHGDGSSHCDKRETLSAFDIGNDTQTALDAMDILRYGIEPNLGSLKHEREEGNEDLRCQKLGECNHIEKGVQAIAFSVGISPGRKRGLPSRSPTGSKAIGKKDFARGASKTSKKVGKTASLKSPGPAFTSSKRLLLDFSSAMVPRRKRSRLCSPRVSFNENIEAFRWKKSGPRLYEPHQEADKQDKAEGRKNIRRLGNSTELSVLTESTNGRRTKRDLSIRSDCNILLEQSRKRRKCESKSIFVLFSHSLSEAIIKQQKKMLKKLRGHVATSAANATHFVADSFVRSKNMLEIMASGKAVVTTNWLEGCSQAQYFVDEESYILEDAQKEKEWGFCMHSSLASSRRRPLLKGMKVVVSPNTVPDFTAMKAIIESAGGQVLQKLSIPQQLKPDNIGSISFVLASEEDSDICAEYIRQGCRVYSTELILHGVVVQSLDLSRNRLFVD